MAVSRRGAMAAAGVAALAGAVKAATAPQSFVLVHGAWHGGWCWRDVAAALRAKGHTVLSPTLTGMGDRVHLGTATTGVSVHAEDIVRAVEAEELTGVTLVLHSYAGLPGSLAADRLGNRVARLVYLDAIFPEPGKTLTSGSPQAMIDGAKASLIDGVRLPPFPPAAFGVTDPAQVAWLTRRLTTMPWHALVEPLPPLGAAWTALPKHYVKAARNSLDGPKLSADRAKAAGWTMHSLDTGHDTMVTAPRETAALLEQIATA